MAKRQNPIDRDIDAFLKHECRASVKKGKVIRRVVTLFESPKDLTIGWDCLCGHSIRFTTAHVNRHRDTLWLSMIDSCPGRRLMTRVLEGSLTREKAIEKLGDYWQAEAKLVKRLNS